MLIIDSWLKGTKNFYTGRNIYSQYGTNKAIKSLLDKGESPVALRILEQSLIELNNAKVRPVAANETATVKVAQTEQMPIDETDITLKALTAEWKPYYAEMNMIRHNLSNWGTDNSATIREKRYELAAKILELDKKCNQIWANRDYYLKWGRLPDVEEKQEEIPTNPIELATCIDSCKRMIRRYRLTKDKNSKHAQLYKDWCTKYSRFTNGKTYE